MELGEKLRLARMEAGLTQRQLCGGEITRNMLSQIEHGTAKPSMKTLQYLAGQLGKSVSYFLEETAVVSPNQEVMESARRLYDAEDYAQAALVLEGYRTPDAVYDREQALLWALTHMKLAANALQQGRTLYAQELLGKVSTDTAYLSEDLNRQKLLLLGQIPGQKVCRQLPSLDRELLLRAEDALSAGDLTRAGHLLEAAENRDTPRWQLLRGDTYLAEQDYRNAARCFHAAETAYPKQTVPKLELCYRELKDYRRAYEYACKQKGI